MVWKFLVAKLYRARSHNKLDIWPANAHFFRQAKPIRLSWHVDVGEYDTNSGALFQNVQRLRRVGSFPSHDAVVHERIGRRHPNERLVFYDQHFFEDCGLHSNSTRARRRPFLSLRLLIRTAHITMSAFHPFLPLAFAVAAAFTRGQVYEQRNAGTPLSSPKRREAEQAGDAEAGVTRGVQGRR